MSEIAPVAHLIPSPSSNLVDCGSDAGCLRIAAAAKGGPERLWFDATWSMTGMEGPSLAVELHHVDSMLGFHPERPPRPVYRSDDGAWTRLDEAEVIALPDGRHRLRWSLPTPARSLRLAACYPYTPADLAATLQATGLDRQAIGLSAEGRELLRVANRCDAEGDQRPGVYLIARQHAAETPGSWALDGVLRAFADEQADDPMVWALPFADRDGVEAGRYGKNHWPLDFNRAWFHDSLRHETLVYRQDAERWAARCRPAIMIDFHAPGYGDREVYFFEGMDEQGPRTRDFLVCCARHFGSVGESERFVRQSAYMRRQAEQIGIHPPPTASDFFAGRWSDCVAVNLETSYQRIGDDLATIDGYRALGARLAAAIREWCGRHDYGQTSLTR